MFKKLEQLSHLSSVQSMFTNGESLPDFITLANAQLSKLQSDEAIKTVIQYIESPPSPPKFIVEEVKEEQELEQAPTTNVVITGTGIVDLPSGRISFLNPSEIFPEEDQLDQSPQQEQPELQKQIAPASEQPNEQSDAPTNAIKKRNYHNKYRNKARKNGGEDGHSNSSPEKKNNQEGFVKKSNDGVKKSNGFVKEKKKFVKKDSAGVKEVVA